MRIEELSDEQKTAMLARLCGWGVSTALGGTSYESIFIYTQDNERCANLYDPANMALAWRVLNWAGANFNKARPGDWRGAMYGSRHSAISEWVGLSPADAQRAWLDRILSLAIEAGMAADE